MTLPALRTAYRLLAESPGAFILNARAVQWLETQLRVPMPGPSAVAITEALDQAGVGAWMVGGWGADALVGRQTRRHRDLDLVLADADEQRALSALAGLGFRTIKRTALHMVPPLHLSIRLRDGAGREVDALPVDLGALGAPGADAADVFATGTVEGRPAQCLSASAQLRLREGYRHRPRDRRDVALLEGRGADAPPLRRSELRDRILPAARRRLAGARGRGPTALNIHVWAADGKVVAPHITLINPFMPANRLDASVEEELARLVARFAAFDFELARLGRFPGILYVAPEPAEPFVALVEALTAQWPEHPPYQGAFDTVIPHLTCAHGRGRLALSDELARALPIRASATEVDLMVMGRNGRWSQRASFPLGPR